MEKGLSRVGEMLQICWRRVIKGMLAGRGGVRGEQQRDEWRAAGVVGGQASGRKRRRRRRGGLTESLNRKECKIRRRDRVRNIHVSMQVRVQFSQKTTGCDWRRRSRASLWG